MATTNRLERLRLQLVAGETAQEIGARIRSRRQKLGLNQRQLADLIPEPSVGNQRVSDWERGVHQPSERYLRLLAAALKVEIAYFYGANVEGTTTTPPLLDVLVDDEGQAGEVLATLRLLVERQEAVEAALTELAERVAEALPQAPPRRRRASGR